MTSSEAYPVAHSVEELIKEQPAEMLDRQVTVRQVLNLLAETTVEYEHGTANVECLDESLTMAAYGKVVEDLILTIVNALE